jgi:protoporphyrinogen oxidase
MAPDVDLVVIGAGPAGVGAAQRAAKAGRRVVVVEREPHVGGLSGSFEVAGLRVDHGSHRLHRSIDPAILAELRRLLGEDLQRRVRNGRIRLQGRWVAFPLRPRDMLTSLPLGFAAAGLLESATAFARRPREDTFDEVIRAGLGPTMADRFYGPYARKLWGLAPEEIDGEQARRRVGASSPAAVLRRILGGADEESRTFLYPRRGFGQISEALAASATEAGADVRLGTEVTGLRDVEQGVEVRTSEGTVAASRVWSTVPLPLLARLWGPTPPAVRDAARQLETRAMVLVYLVLDRPRYTDFDAHYLPEGWTPVTRISEPKNYRESRDDPHDRTVLCAEIPCARGDALWSSGGAELGALVGAALERSGLPAPHPAEVRVRRVPAAYPVYRRGFAEHRDRLDAWASSLPRVLTLGRQGLFVHDNSHHALAMAWAAVDALDADGFDGAAWARARERFAGHVVED